MIFERHRRFYTKEISTSRQQLKSKRFLDIRSYIMIPSLYRCAQFRSAHSSPSVVNTIALPIAPKHSLSLPPKPPQLKTFYTTTSAFFIPINPPAQQTTRVAGTRFILRNSERKTKNLAMSLLSSSDGEPMLCVTLELLRGILGILTVGLEVWSGDCGGVFT